MEPIRVVRGTATGPTATASYDAALAAAGVENYNLVTVSSVVPGEAPVEVVGTAPSLGPPGNRLTVVQARATVSGPGVACAGLGWSREPDGPGIFYEVSDADPRATDGGTAATATDALRDDVERRVRAGLDAGRGLRDWAFDGERVLTETVTGERDAHATAVLLAVYGRSEPMPTKA